MQSSQHTAKRRIARGRLDARPRFQWTLKIRQRCAKIITANEQLPWRISN